MIIEVRAWGDFDIPHTLWIGESLRYSNHDETREALVKEFLKSKNITKFKLTPNGASRIDEALIYELPHRFINFLKKKGFKKVETVSAIFSD